MWFLWPSVDICVIGLAVCAVLKGRAEKNGFLSRVEAQSLFYPLPSPLWGPVRPRYFPSLIDSRDGPLAAEALSVYECVVVVF